jgi:hypothetical protein
LLELKPKISPTIQKLYHHWHKAKPNKFKDIPALTGAGGCCALSKRLRLTAINKLTEKVPDNDDDIKNWHNYRHNGLFVFGGKNSGGKLTNKLFMVEIGVATANWTFIEGNGAVPAPRHLHTMNFMKEIDCLVVYGGRNDGFGGMFEDIHLFDLLNYEWKIVNHEGTVPVGRSCHASAVIKDQ